jgi:superfamily II RNA helicase
MRPCTICAPFGGELLRQQEQADVVVPVWYEAELMGLVQAWAKGVSWNDLIANTSLDEGDVVRIMRRTVDLLAQIPYCEAVSEQLRSNARLALKAINRFPVCEPIDLAPGAPGPTWLRCGRPGGRSTSHTISSRPLMLTTV